MNDALIILTVLIGLAVAVPVLVFVAECLLAFLPARPHVAAGLPEARPRLAVIVPAHNEASGLGAALTSITAQTQPGDRVVVVADNCDDATADVARGFAGVEAIERHDEHRRGKGFALAAGMDVLRDDPPAVVVIIDADCLLTPDALSRLAAVAGNGDAPVQGVYLLEPTGGAPGMMGQLSTFAFLVKNLVRQRGLAALDLPAVLQGTGMAFPWLLLDTIDLESADIVEDLAMGLDLLAMDRPATFCVEAGVTSAPADTGSTLAQRTRWEQGYLRTMLSRCPKLILKGLLGRPGTLAVGLDLAVPPLSLLMLLYTAALALSAASGAITGRWWPAAGLASLGLLLAVVIAAVCLRFGRGVIQLRTLALAPLYALWKLPIYLGILFNPQTQWVRTARSDNADGPAPPPTPTPAPPDEKNGPKAPGTDASRAHAPAAPGPADDPTPHEPVSLP